MTSQPAGPTELPDLDPALLEIIVCPRCHGDLDLVATDQGAAGGELACRGECRLVYPVRDQIPVLLVDEARPGDGVDRTASS